MAGISGYAGEHPDGVNYGIDLSWTGREYEGTFEDDWVQISQWCHSDECSAQPIELLGGELLWIWGDVYGHRNGDGYSSRRASGLSKLAFLQRRLGPDWRRGVGGLNGSFVIVVYDPDERAVHIVTDKLLTRSLYYTSTREGLVFSPRIQSLFLETDLSPSPDLEHLQAFFATGLSGIYTPIEDTYMCPPGSILTYDIPAGTLSTETYWRPEHNPVDKSVEWFTDEFIRRLEDAIRDRVADHRKISLLLSGGGDSRLLAAVLDGLDVEYTAYHATSWESSYETTIARKVSDQLGMDLEVLTRTSDHFEDLLGEPMKMYNFRGFYEQAHMEPFIEELTAGTELVFTGDFSDALFKGLYLPRRRYRTRVDNVFDVELGSFELNDFIHSEFGWANPPYYFTGECEPLSATVHRNVYQSGDEVVNHGITFGSAKDLLMSYGFYPSARSSPYFRRSLLENTGLRTPFADDRLVDLYLKMPVEFVFQHNVLNKALSRIDLGLSVLANASTTLPPVVGYKYHKRLNLELPESRAELNLPDPPEGWQGHDPWGYAMHNDDLIREAILDNQETIESAPFLDDERLLQQATDHNPWGDGEFHGYEYRELLSFICSPIADRLV